VPVYGRRGHQISNDRRNATAPRLRTKVASRGTQQRNGISLEPAYLGVSRRTQKDSSWSRADGLTGDSHTHGVKETTNQGIRRQTPSTGGKGGQNRNAAGGRGQKKARPAVRKKNAGKTVGGRTEEKNPRKAGSKKKTRVHSLTHTVSSNEDNVHREAVKEKTSADGDGEKKAGKEKVGTQARQKKSQKTDQEHKKQES